MVRMVSSLTARHADESTMARGIESEELMRRVAEGVLKNAPFREGRTLILCGKGGNGGDGYALYLLMKEKRFAVDVMDFGESKHQGAIHWRNLCANDILSFSENSDFSVYSNIVDCIFGIGLKRAPQGEYLSAIKKINSSDAFVLSVDIASGLTSDGGIALGETVRANVTIAVQDMKVGHFLSDGLDCSGEVGVLDIGLEPSAPDALMVEEEDLIELFPPLKRNVHKGTLGRLSIIGGCEAYSGAAVLAELGASAFALGDGLVKLCVPDSILYPVMNKITECTLLAMPSKEGRIAYSEKYMQKAIVGANAVLFGNGADITEDGQKILAYLIENVSSPLVLDADALNMLSTDPSILKNRIGKTILTPHPREMSRLMGVPTEEILSDPVSYAKEFACRYGVILVLKGASTVITDGARTYLSASGSPGMAKGGSGDLLAGAIAALIAGGREPIKAAYGASYILGLAGESAANEVGAYSSLPTDTHRHIAIVIKALSDKAAR